MQVVFRHPSLLNPVAVLSFEFYDLVYELNMGEEHSPAAVLVQTKIVKHVLRMLACGHSPDEWLPLVANDLSAGETSYGDYHALLSPSSRKGSFS